MIINAKQNVQVEIDPKQAILAIRKLLLPNIDASSIIKDGYWYNNERVSYNEYDYVKSRQATDNELETYYACEHLISELNSLTNKLHLEPK